MNENSIYEVTREDYKGFVSSINPECRTVEEKRVGINHIATKIFSKKTGKCLCSRLTSDADYGEHEPERYYIFEMPEPEERIPPKPVVRVQLTTKEQVQKFFDYIAQHKEQKNE